ncbi:Phage integrase family protein [Roseimaritima multifibrata]|uniref:Phage integrase family protein n=1 Tax=Roseimaritima multifibrata TaxID=1930274 RepID=A0A517MA02_9BACT|nr:site-specific integrase [Roseimaritima multifibrata]QDS91671.1 Phage integrase family protein [Roseimaritima multifibrata]
MSAKLPKYRKHQSGRARVTINGRDYYLGPYGTKASHREYDRVIAEYLGSGRSGTFGMEQECYTVAMLLADYARHARRYYGTDESSEFHRIKRAVKPLKHLYAKVAADEFGPNRFKTCRQQLIDDGLSRNGINAHMKRVARMFKWAAAEGKIPATVYQTLRLIDSLKAGRTEAYETEPVLPVSQEVINATLPMLSQIVADMVSVQLLVGCRPAEICRLTPGCIDREGEVWIATLTEHKTKHHGHSRRLFIGPQAQGILLPYLDRNCDEKIFQPIEADRLRRKQQSKSRITPISCGNRPGKRSGGLKGSKGKKRPGSEFTTNSYRRAIHNACDNAFPAPVPLRQLPGESDAARWRRLTETECSELKKWQSKHRWSPNRLRHSRGTDIRREYGLEAAQVVLGHAKADVTQVYAERDIELAKKVAKEYG